MPKKTAQTSKKSKRSTKTAKSRSASTKKVAKKTRRSSSKKKPTTRSASRTKKATKTTAESIWTKPFLHQEQLDFHGRHTKARWLLPILICSIGLFLVILYLEFFRYVMY